MNYLSFLELGRVIVCCHKQKRCNKRTGWGADFFIYYKKTMYIGGNKKYYWKIRSGAKKSKVFKAKLEGSIW